MRTFREYAASRKMIGAKEFRAYPMGDRYRELSDRLGHDFSATITLLDRLPTFMEGASHKAARKAMALRNEAGKPQQLAAVGEFLAAFADRWLRPGETVDLFADFGKPLFETMALSASTLGDLGGDVARLVTEFPLLFSPTTPLRRRLEINALLTRIVAGRPAEIHEDLALLVLGVFPLSGSLALSLHAIFTENQGARLDAIPWPAEFPRSSLHFVDRVCIHASTAQGEQFAVGDRIRCMIRGDDWEEAQVRAMFFGAGAHLCLGKQLSETIWAMTTTMLAARPLAAEALPIVMQRDEEPFRLPRQAQVRFAA